MGWYSQTFLQISNDNNFTFFLQIYCHDCNSVSGYLFINVRNTSYQSFASACSSNITRLPMPFYKFSLAWGQVRLFSLALSLRYNISSDSQRTIVIKEPFRINQQIVLSGNQQIYMVDLVKNISSRMSFFGLLCLPRVLN